MWATSPSAAIFAMLSVSDWLSPQSNPALPNHLRQGKTKPVLGHSPWPVLRRPRMAGFEVTTEGKDIGMC
jgi:hypothetical protein